jgi:hypothetical protein
LVDHQQKKDTFQFREDQEGNLRRSAARLKIRLTAFQTKQISIRIILTKKEITSVSKTARRKRLPN